MRWSGGQGEGEGRAEVHSNDPHSTAGTVLPSHPLIPSSRPLHCIAPSQLLLSTRPSSPFSSPLC